MKPTISTTLWLPALALLAVAGCAAPPSKNGAAAAPADLVRCSSRIVPDAMVDGKVVKPGLSGLLTFTLVALSPDPPQVGLNTWTVTLTDATGAPVTGATFDKIVPYMPDHGHGASTLPTVTAVGDSYSLEQLNFFMPGLWQVSLTATTPAKAVDTAVFDLCAG